MEEIGHFASFPLLGLFLLHFKKRGESPGVVVVQWVAACSGTYSCVFFCGEISVANGLREREMKFQVSEWLLYSSFAFLYRSTILFPRYRTICYFNILLFFPSERCICTRKLLATHWWHAVKPTAHLPVANFLPHRRRKDKGLAKQTYIRKGAIS